MSKRKITSLFNPVPKKPATVAAKPDAEEKWREYYEGCPPKPDREQLIHEYITPDGLHATRIYAGPGKQPEFAYVVVNEKRHIQFDVREVGSRVYFPYDGFDGYDLNYIRYNGEQQFGIVAKVDYSKVKDILHRSERWLAIYYDIRATMPEKYNPDMRPQGWMDDDKHGYGKVWRIATPLGFLLRNTICTGRCLVQH